MHENPQVSRNIIKQDVSAICLSVICRTLLWFSSFFVSDPGCGVMSTMDSLLCITLLFLHKILPYLLAHWGDFNQNHVDLQPSHFLYQKQTQQSVPTRLARLTLNQCLPLQQITAGSESNAKGRRILKYRRTLLGLETEMGAPWLLSRLSVCSQWLMGASLLIHTAWPHEALLRSAPASCMASSNTPHAVFPLWVLFI